MFVEPTADTWGRSSSKVRLQLRAGRCRATGHRTGGAKGKIWFYLPPFRFTRASLGCCRVPTNFARKPIVRTSILLHRSSEMEA